MTVTFRAAKRERVALLLGLAGGTGSGKTNSAMLIAQGLAAGRPWCVIDTENGRAQHFADEFRFDAADLRAPFRPDAYAEAIDAAAKGGYAVIVVDSMTHEWDGDGGILDWQTEEFQRMGGRDAVKLTSWIAPKMSHRKFVTRLLQVPAHVILCFRASEKIEMVRDEHGKMQVLPKHTPTGLDGWVPITEKNLPFELTASFLLLASAPGVPHPIKLPGALRPFVPLDRPITADVGRALAGWAAGAGVREPPSEEELAGLGDQYLALVKRAGGDVDAVQVAIEKHTETHDRAAHRAWLERCIASAEAKAEAKA